MDNALYWMWLANAVGSACKYAVELLKEYPDARTLYEAYFESGELPRYLSTHAKQMMIGTEPQNFEDCLELCSQMGVKILTPDCPDYPQRLLELPDFPLVLYATGDTACLNGLHYVGMVGTRRPTAYGKQVCHDLSLEMAKRGAVIVSGLADGLDGAGHRAAVEAGKPTVAYMGTAIDQTYPAANARLRQQIEEDVGGCVLSEYPPNYEGRAKGTFLARNRLIAGQSEILCVAEARTKSGTLNTVEHAERYGRTVFAVPGSIYSAVSEGTNELLRTHRAEVLCSAENVMDALSVNGRVKVKPKETAPLWEQETLDFPLSETAQKIFALLGPKPIGVEELRAKTNLSAQEILAGTMELEFAGKVLSHPGRLYTAK